MPDAKVFKLHRTVTYIEFTEVVAHSLKEAQEKARAQRRTTWKETKWRPLGGAT